MAAMIEPPFPDRVRGTAAAALVSSRLSGGVLGRLADEVAPRDERDAYGVQLAAHRLLSSTGFGRRAGWKIGCTTPVMQAYLKIANPCAGGMFQANVWHGSHSFSALDKRRLGVECEVAVRIGRDLPRRALPYEVGDVAAAVAACMAAIEVVEDRYLDYPTLDTPTLIADDFFHHSCVLGRQDERFEPSRLRDVTASMAINGDEVGSGKGADIMGDPMSVLCWLANSSIEWGAPLVNGDVVLLGSLVQTQWVVTGDVVTVENEPLGEVRAEFVAR